MEFNNNIPDWVNEGTEPSDDLKTNGFKSGYKPPAGVFNWLFSLLSKAINEIQQNLSNVDNTKDSEKSVNFASEAGIGRKLKYALTVRFKGGDTEGTDKWTFDGSTSRSINITPDKIGAANADEGVKLVPAYSTDGEVYTATVDSVTELYNGLEITIIPNMTSTKSAVQFNLNGLGAKNLRVKIDGYNSGNSGTISALATWIGENYPLTIRYVEKFDMWQTVDFSRQSASGIYGTIKVEGGGTGADTAEEARANLGAQSIITSGTAEPTGGVDGDVYIQILG